RKVVNEMQDGENEALRQRTIENEANEKWSLVIMISESLLAIALVSFGQFVITERKKSERKIKQLSLVATRTDSAVIITDGTGRIEWVNDSFARISEYTPDEVRGQKFGTYLQGSAGEAADLERMYAQVGKGEGFKDEILHYSKMGRKYWL